jgi:predicted RNase H-like nuclease (RuvC/YqgF family)
VSEHTQPCDCAWCRFERDPVYADAREQIKDLLAEQTEHRRELERVSRSNEELRGEVEIKNEEISTLTAALRDAERECEEAAARWRASADKERREGSRSSMCGEEGVPSHVITTARAISWEGAAKTIAALAGGLTRIEDSSTSDSTELNSARAAQEGDV